MEFWDRLIVLAAYVLVMSYSGLIADTFIANEESNWHPATFIGAWWGLGIVSYWTWNGSRTDGQT